MLISIILGFIISYYYNRNFKGPFVLYFIISSIVLFILFYFLGNCKSDVENFANNPKKNIPSEEYNYRRKRINIPSEEYNYRSKRINVPSEEHNYRHQRKHIPSEEYHTSSEEHHIPSEEHHTPSEEHHTQSEEHHIPSEEHHYNKQNKHLISGKYAHLEEEDTISSHTPSNIQQTPLQPNCGTSGNNPVNINISYNSQNSVNELDNNETKSMKTPISNNNNVSEQIGKKYTNRNLGPINPPNDDSVGSRINTDGDWIYGKQAWTNNPDYYSPEEYIKQTYKKGWNEMTEANKYRKNTDVCPLMANVPWTEYKSGDSEPEPYNVK